MDRVTCVRCGSPTPMFDVVHAGDSDGSQGKLCSDCFNQEMARRRDLTEFESVHFDPIRLVDARGLEHEFFFRVHLVADLSIEAFELVDGDPGGYQFQILGEVGTDVWELFARLVTRMRNALSKTHLESGRFGRQIADRSLRGRIESDPDGIDDQPRFVIDGCIVPWDEVGRMLLTFEGWQFRLELIDRSEDVT